MVRYCQSCGRAAPNDAVLCPYCGVQIDYSRSHIIPDQKPAEKDSKIALIIVLVVVVLIAITVAIAATVYVYVSGMIGPDGMSHSPYVTVSEVDNQISIRLVQEGTDYNNGYTNFKILVNGDPVDDLSEVGSWTIGEEIIIGADNSGYKVDGTPLSYGDYEVKVYIQDTLVCTRDISI